MSSKILKTVKIMIVKTVRQCAFVGRYQRFAGTYYLLFLHKVGNPTTRTLVVTTHKTSYNLGTICTQIITRRVQNHICGTGCSGDLVRIVSWQLYKTDMCWQAQETPIGTLRFFCYESIICSLSTILLKSLQALSVCFRRLCFFLYLFSQFFFKDLLLAFICLHVQILPVLSLFYPNLPFPVPYFSSYD